MVSMAMEIAALGLDGLPNDLFGNRATSLFCMAMLVFGLPHGSLDIAVIRRSGAIGERQVVAIVLLYLGLAAVTYSIWLFAPVVALSGFLIIASIHFADDWADTLPPFFAMGIAAALLTASGLLHHQAVAAIFVSLTGQQGATLLADLSVLVAPVALITTATAMGIMFSNGRTRQAVETGAVIIGMILLPPVVGFSIFFCLSHSPRHFIAARAQSVGKDAEAMLLTSAAIGIAALVYTSRSAMVLEDKTIFASFVTLSVLTVPHMLVPNIVNRRWLSAQAQNSPSGLSAFPR